MNRPYSIYSKMRRRFLSRMASVAGIVAAEPLLAVDTNARGLPERTRCLLKRVSVLINDKASADAIGRAYLEQRDLEGKNSYRLDAILNDLITDLGGEGAVVRSTREQLKNKFAVRNRQDFASRNVVRVRGWVLSATEVKLYAVAALS